MSESVYTDRVRAQMRRRAKKNLCPCDRCRRQRRSAVELWPRTARLHGKRGPARRRPASRR